MTQPAFSAPLDPRAGGSGLSVVRDRLRNWLQEVGLAEPDLHELLIAAGEACTNAVEHSGARSDGGEPAAWISGTCDKTQIRIVVTDRGRWKEPESAPAPTGRRGRGRLVMVNLVDRMDIRTGPDGTVVELIKERR